LRKADTKNEKIGKELVKRGIKEDKQSAYADALRKQLKTYNDVLKDSTSSPHSFLLLVRNRTQVL
jgi:hypothetical protein